MDQDRYTWTRFVGIGVIFPSYLSHITSHADLLNLVWIVLVVPCF